ncbi:hypothetical protein [Teredinibacter purpureus]|jgi:hypothetical protein|uniref:hypothetical protein n=1 Tax=Teredinibacter purpureus TaxID=2731756 RepID=UPI0013C4D921|nr:hypothetical protein [Teredinibacter purpureus]
MARRSYCNDNNKIDSTSDEPTSVKEINAAISELNHSMSTLNRAMLKLQQHVTRLNAANTNDSISIPKTLH